MQLRRIRQLTEGGLHREALAAIEALAPDALEHRDALFMRAVNLRYLGRVPEALAALEYLEQRHAHFGRLHQERGHCHATAGRRTEAIDAFARAVQSNPTLSNSWRMLERLYRQEGDFRRAAGAVEQLVQLQRQPTEMLRAAGLFADGELRPAEDLLRAYLASQPEHIEARRLLARISLRAQRYAQAREQADALLALEPGNEQDLSLCAAACSGLGDHAAAIAFYGRLLATAPASPEIHVLRGHSFRAIGRPWDAIESYRAAAAIRPNFGDAYWSLANLKVYRFSSEEVALMLAAASAPTTACFDRYHLCFALGREFESRGDHAQSFSHYQRGNALKRAEVRYRHDAVEAEAQRQIQLFTAAFFSARAEAGAPAADPIFIVGLPRSGSTLVEQILASHSRVEGTHELAEVPRLVSELRPLYPGVLSEWPPQEFRARGERYLSETRVYRRGHAHGKAFFIDKMPNNFLHLGFIHLMLPKARIIDVRREPMACCWSNLQQLYAGGQEFSYSIEDVARYYRTYLALMRHWDQVLPGSVLRVHYEDVVDDVETSVRRMLDFCALEYEPACLKFHETRRSINSASSEQVRRPLFQEGLTGWRNFEPWLGGLKDALGDAVVRYRD